MSLKIKKVITHIPWLLFLSLGINSTVFAAGSFYTIIGPDGHPMVVQQKVETNKKQEVKVVEKSKIVQQNTEQVQLQPENTLKEKAVKKETSSNVNVEPKIPIKDEIDVSLLEKKQAQTVSTVDSSTKIVSSSPIQKKEPSINIQVPHKISSSSQLKQDKAQEKDIPRIVETKTPISKKQQELNSTVVENPSVVIQKDADQLNENFTVIDGEKYVNNEYLEDKEFNLEGKKRFYVMPESGVGARHVETVEREKGLSHSLIEKIQAPKPAMDTPIALAPTYYRLPKDEVIQNLEQSCFSGKKIEKAKSLTLKDKEVGFWPVTPIKEKFAYEVVKLDQNVQDILFTSYASSNKTPSYYWPLVVFLDQKGCVIEGVSGFKNQDISESNFQHAALEGVLKKPSSAFFMFMTPLSSAIDVENKQLTNQGQIKLSVIR